MTRGDREIVYVPNVYVPFPAPNDCSCDAMAHSGPNGETDHDNGIQIGHSNVRIYNNIVKDYWLLMATQIVSLSSGNPTR